MQFSKDATVEELQTGVRLDEEQQAHVCLLCGKRFPGDQFFPEDGAWYDAKTAALRHAAEHGSLLDALLDEDRKLTENQKNLLRLLHSGLSDMEIAEKTGVAASTVRQQRFLFREKARAARLYLAIYSLALDRQEKRSGRTPAKSDNPPLPETHEGATMVDDRYFIEDPEERRILQNMFLTLQPLRLKKLSPKEKKKVVCLRRIAAEFEPGRRYTEKEVNAMLKAIFPEDYATLRRYLIEYRFLDRTRDCQAYWRP